MQLKHEFLFNIKLISMKNFIFMMAFAIMCVMTSCNKDESLQHVPATADGVAVINFDITSDTPEEADIDKLLNYFKENKVEITSLQEAFIKSMLTEPEKCGLDFLRKWAFYVDYTPAKKEDVQMGIIIPISKRETFKNTLISLNNAFQKEMGDFMKESKTQNELEYIQLDEHSIIGWNDNLFVYLAGTKEQGPSQLLTVLGMEKSASILTNDDFQDFNDECQDYNVWISSSFMADPNFIELMNDEIAGNYSENNYVKYFMTESGLKFEDNYLHYHVQCEKDEYTATMKFKPNEAFQEADFSEILQAAIDVTQEYQRDIDEYCEKELEKIAIDSAATDMPDEFEY